ncbi:response regulator [Sphingobium chlorophenolicum]|uniref:CheY-like response regulator n=1 Tax=Sphingobium chlorophenolicum TaxID=46429 RepID=A0A081RE26_SPHCR|nr:response regulator [Sphingobium chlorophenolicum]KEQ53449.1 CheY-like response regulator [Sphingobium chlorophenolicum]
MGQHILLVENDPTVAALIAGLLEEADYAVDGPHATLADGVAAVAKHMPVGAVLDVRLDGGDVGLLADDLDLYDIPYIFCSGASDDPVVDAHPAAPLIPRPALARRLVPTLRHLLR